jgi:signal transduction histidine kinase
VRGAWARSLWERLGRLDPRAVDGGAAGALFVVAAAQLLHGGAGEALHLPTVAGATLALYRRRQAPLAGYAFQFLCALFTLEPPTLGVLIALFLGLYSAAVYSRHRLGSLAAPVASAAVLAILFPFSYPALPAWGLELVVGVGLWLAGSAMRERQARAQVLEEHSRQLERQHELVAQVAVSDERSRIARELHDVIAHSVSVMVVQAGAARRLLGRQPERAGEAMREVEGSGREALTELRRLLGVLAARPDELVLAPQPGLGQLDALVQRVDAAGIPVDLRIVGAPRPLPPGLDLAAYRIVQEALTNVVKHAAGARTEVVVEYGDRDLRLAVVDAGGAGGAGTPDGQAGAGRGLLGMHERAAAYGGDVEALAQPDGGFAVRARLPLEQA